MRVRWSFVAPCVLTFFSIVPTPASAEDITLLATADTWTHGLDDATNHGVDTRLTNCPRARYWIYLKFDVSSIEGAVTQAELRLTRFEGSRPQEISFYFIPDDDWTEATLTGPSRPNPRDPDPATALGNGVAAGSHDRWSSPALASVINEEIAGDGIVTLMVREDPSDVFDVRRFFSREGAANDASTPQLLLSVEPPPPEERVDENWRVVDVAIGVKPAFDFGPDGRVHIMGMTEESFGEVWHSVADSVSGPWNTVTVDVGYFYGPGDILVDADGNAHMAFHDHDLANAKHVIVDPDQSEMVFEVDTPGTHDGWDNALAFDSSGTLHQSSISPSGFGSLESLQYSVFDGGTWIPQDVIGSGPAMYGLSTSIAIDRDNRPHMVLCRSDDWTAPGDLVYVVREDAGWDATVIVTDGIRGRFPSMALDHWDRPHVVWLDIDENDFGVAYVRYGVLNRGEWEIETIDVLEDVWLGFSGARKSVSLQLDESSRPHVAYSDQRTVKYATKPFGDWDITEVVGIDENTYKSLVVLRLDADDLPAIVFWQPHPDVSEPGQVRFASLFDPCAGENPDPGLCDKRPVFHRGDVDSSATLDISDSVAIFGFLFIGTAEPGCLEAADPDNSGELDITDGVYLLNFLFSGGPPPTDPGPLSEPCGPDPDEPGSDGDLGCESYTAC
jgi:hypothetical protein